MSFVQTYKKHAWYNKNCLKPSENWVCCFVLSPSQLQHNTIRYVKPCCYAEQAWDRCVSRVLSPFPIKFRMGSWRRHEASSNSTQSPRLDAPAQSQTSKIATPFPQGNKARWNWAMRHPVWWKDLHLLRIFSTQTILWDQAKKQATVPNREPFPLQNAELLKESVRGFLS